MPRYYFLVCSPLGVEADQSGLELPGDEQAQEWGLRAVHDIRAEDPSTDWRDWYVKVRDSAGNLILDVPVEAPTSPSRTS